MEKPKHGLLSDVQLVLSLLDSGFLEYTRRGWILASRVTNRFALQRLPNRLLRYRVSGCSPIAPQRHRIARFDPTSKRLQSCSHVTALNRPVVSPWYPRGTRERAQEDEMMQGTCPNVHRQLLPTLDPRRPQVGRHENLRDLS